MEEFITSKSEREGAHWFLWQQEESLGYIKTNRIHAICGFLTAEYQRLTKFYANKRDDTIHKEIKWHQYLSTMSDPQVDTFCITKCITNFVMTLQNL